MFKYIVSNSIFWKTFIYLEPVFPLYFPSWENGWLHMPVWEKMLILPESYEYLCITSKFLGVERTYVQNVC